MELSDDDKLQEVEACLEGFSFSELKKECYLDGLLFQILTPQKDILVRIYEQELFEKSYEEIAEVLGKDHFIGFIKAIRNRDRTMSLQKAKDIADKVYISKGWREYAKK